MRHALPLAVATAVGCVSYAELPLCGDIAKSQRPASRCDASLAALNYKNKLADEILRWSQGNHPAETVVRVRLDSEGRLAGVCAGSAEEKASWSTRDRVAAARETMQTVGPVPPCLVGKSFEITGALVERSAGWQPPIGMIACEGGPDVSCTGRATPVCGVFRYQRRQTFANACDACRVSGVVGYLEFDCRFP